MKKKVELHVHTRYSYDCDTSFQEIIEKCLKENINAVAITDHNEIEGAKRLKKMAPFEVIVGEEILTKEGEIIGLFLKEFIPPGLSMRETVERIKGQGGVTYLPHPFDRTTRKTAIHVSKIETCLPEIDIVEVFNARTIFPGDNKKAKRLALKYKKPMGVGSDAHTKYELGRTFLEMPEFSTPEGFLKSLEKTKIRTRSVMPWVFLLTKWARFKKRNFRKRRKKLPSPKTECNLCGGKNFAVLYKRRGKIGRRYFITDDSYGFHYQLVECLDCGLVFSYPRDENQKIIEKYTSFKDPLYEKERKTRGENQKGILEKINRLAGRKGSLLEVGCATGVFLEHAQADGWDVLGVEPSRWAVRLAQEKYNLPVVQGTVEEADFGRKKFDVVVCIDVIEHVTDPKNFLSKINQVLKPGGILCIVTPDKKSLVARILSERWWHIRPDHIYYFSKDTLFSMLISTGFLPEKVERYGWTFSYDYWILRFKNLLPLVFKILEDVKRVPVLRSITKKYYHINFRDSLIVYARNLK